MTSAPSAPSDRDWTETVLWSELSTRKEAADKQVLNFLERWMTNIQMILRSGGTSPLPFTLHDASHSFRVAQRMAQIIPATFFRSLQHMNSLYFCSLRISMTLE